MQMEWITPAEVPQVRNTPVYGTGPWLACVAEVSPIPLRILALRDEGQIVAWHPFLEMKRGPLRRALPLWVQTTGGPYYAFPESVSFSERARWLRQVQAEMFQALASHAHFATLVPYESDPRNLAPHWKVSIRATARLDLNLLPAPLGEQALRKLRKAQNKGLTLARSQNSQSVSDAIEAVQSRHHMHHALSSAKVNELRLRLEAQSLVETWVVSDVNGQEVAFGVVALDPGQDSALMWYPLSTNAALKLYAADFLFGKLAEVYRGRFRWLDLCGTDLTNLIEFKEKWASETVYSFAYEFVRNRALQVALRAFSALRR
jgi:hypothetical protein